MKANFNVDDNFVAMEEEIGFPVQNTSVAGIPTAILYVAIRVFIVLA
jgi:hypothetical protein